MVHPQDRLGLCKKRYAWRLSEVPTDQFGERRFGALRREALQQLLVRQRDGRPAQTTNVTQQNGRVRGSHDADS
jgi:hypothetical protein